MFTELSSLLYPLPAIGVGSALVESLTSYVVRLAFKHYIFVFVLLIEQAIPTKNNRINKKEENDDSQNYLTTRWFQDLSITFNSLNSQTVEWSDTLSCLTQQKNLKYLSLLTWNDVIPYRALLKTHFEWCPICYAEMMEKGEPIYNPLLWHMRYADYCIKHGCLLENACPYCDKSLIALASKGCNGFCPYCSKWLGVPKAYSAINCLSSTPNPVIYSNWLGDLLAVAPTLENAPKRTIIAETVKTYIEEILDGNGALFARLLGLNHKTVYEWRDGTQIPQLESLLRLCEKIGTTPVAFLTGQTLNNLSLLPVPIFEDSPHSRQKTSYKYFDQEAVSQRLENILNNNEFPPPSTAQVAKRLEYDPSFLHKKLPQKTTLISARFMRFRKQRAEEAQKASDLSLEATIVELEKVGVYSSHRRLRKRFGGKMRSKRLRQTRLRILQKLSIQNQL